MGQAIGTALVPPAEADHKLSGLPKHHHRWILGLVAQQRRNQPHHRATGQRKNQALALGPEFRNQLSQAAGVNLGIGDVSAQICQGRGNPEGEGGGGEAGGGKALELAKGGGGGGDRPIIPASGRAFKGGLRGKRAAGGGLGIEHRRKLIGEGAVGKWGMGSGAKTSP